MSSASPLNDVSESPSRITALRTVTPRRGLPGTRAIVGGLLVTVAVIGAYVAATGATGDHRTTVVVAAHDIPSGVQLKASDLTTARMQLSAAAGDHVFHTSAPYVGAVTLGPLKSGELVQTGGLENPKTATPLPQISISLPAARALGGQLHSGDTVDVLDSGKSTNASTQTIAGDVQIVSVSQASTSLGTNGDSIITFATSNRDDATAIAAANAQGTITLVRTTGVPVDVVTTSTTVAAQ